MNIQEKIKLMLSGKFQTKYGATGQVESICVACGVTMYKGKEIDKDICKKCHKLYFVRATGSEVEGLDLTRELVRIRDKHTCQESAGGCGKVWKHGTRRFDIHHLDGKCGRYSRSYDKRSSMHILVTLCHRCHLNLPEVKEKMRNKSSPRQNKQWTTSRSSTTQ